MQNNGNNKQIHSDNAVTETNLGIHEKNCAVWTSYSTSTLLKLYSSRLALLETHKKKRRIWAAISKDLKDYNIEVTADQVRWKINALTKIYKKCIDSDCHDKFKYFREMNNVYSQYNVDSDASLISELLDEMIATKNLLRGTNENPNRPLESKRLIELRKLRLANRIESDRCQTKINIERQWLDYLQKCELLTMRRDEIIDKALDTKEQELQLKQKELEIKQSLELKKIQLEEKHLDEILIVEKEKCDLLKQIFSCDY